MDPLIPLLDKAANTLGLTVTRLWPQMVMVTYWQSLFWVIFDPIVIGALAAVGIFLTKQITRGDDSDEKVPLTCFIWAILLGVGMAILSSYPDQIAGVAAPEGVTALRLMRQLAGK